MKSNERWQAYQILIALMANKVPLSQSMVAVDLSPMSKEICFGFCRHYFRLEMLAECLLEKRPKSLEIWVILLMGLYQLHYMSQPDYAIVQETVALVDKIKKTWAKSLVNGVLRHFCRQKNELIDSLATNPGFKYGQSPLWLKYLKKDWPKHWQAIAIANDTHPPMTLRVNEKKTDVPTYLDQLAKAGIAAKAHAIAPMGIDLLSSCDVDQLPGFRQGLVSVQDGAAQLAATLLKLKPGLRVLDACCAPGGKTGHILEIESDLSSCIALEIDPKRLLRVQDNLNRLNLDATLVQGDALFPDQWWDKQLFDRILLDAPCSAGGVIRRHSDIKLLRTADEITKVSQTQFKMLRSLWPLLKPGGLMVYATCSILLLENEQQIVKFVEDHSDCKVEHKTYSWGKWTGHGHQILPGEAGMDGFFYSVLIKNER